MSSLQEREVCSLQQQLADELSKRQTVSWITGEVVIQHVEVEAFFWIRYMHVHAPGRVVHSLSGGREEGHPNQL